MTKTAISTNTRSPLDFATFTLKAGEVLRIPSDWTGRTVHPERGKLWITQPGDDSDYFVCSTNGFEVKHSGTVVQALTEAEFRLD